MAERNSLVSSGLEYYTRMRFEQVPPCHRLLSATYIRYDTQAQ